DGHAVVAVAAVQRLLVNERLLQRMQRRRLRKLLLLGIARCESFERGERRAANLRARRYAGADLDPVGQHRAGAALREPAAEARTFEPQLVHEHIEQRRIRALPQGYVTAVHFDLEIIRHGAASLSRHGATLLVFAMARGYARRPAGTSRGPWGRTRLSTHLS